MVVCILASVLYEQEQKALQEAQTGWNNGALRLRLGPRFGPCRSLRARTYKLVSRRLPLFHLNHAGRQAPRLSQNATLSLKDHKT